MHQQDVNLKTNSELSSSQCKEGNRNTSSCKICSKVSQWFRKSTAIPSIYIQVGCFSWTEEEQEKKGLCSLEPQVSLTCLAPGIGFMEDNFSMDQGREDSFGITQAHYIYFYYHYNSSTSDHQAWDPRGRDPCFRDTPMPVMWWQADERFVVPQPEEEEIGRPGTARAML